MMALNIMAQILKYFTDGSFLNMLSFSERRYERQLHYMSMFMEHKAIFYVGN